MIRLSEKAAFLIGEFSHFSKAVGLIIVVPFSERNITGKVQGL